MSKYQKEIERLLNQQDKDLDKKLHAALNDSLKVIKAEVKENMAKYADLNYSRRMETRRLYSLMLQIENELDILAGTQEDHVYHFLNSVGELAYNELFYDFEMSNQVKLNFAMLNKNMLKTIVQTKIDGVKLSTRLRDGSITKLKSVLQETLSRGFNRGWSYQKMAKQLPEAGESSYRRAMTISRTEGGRVSSVTRQRSQDEAIKRGLEVEKQWVSTLDGSTRDSHRKLDGQQVQVDKYFKVNGHRALQPHMFGIAAEDVNCRCRTISKISVYEHALRRDNISKVEINYQKYDDWVASK